MTSQDYFNNCNVVIVTLILMFSFKLVCDSATIGIIYARIARPNTRATTIIFSDNAIIRRIKGKLYFMLQVGLILFLYIKIIPVNYYFEYKGM